MAYRKKNKDIIRIVPFPHYGFIKPFGKNYKMKYLYCYKKIDNKIVGLYDDGQLFTYNAFNGKMI